MAESTIVKNQRSGTLKIKVGANSYTVNFQEGRFALNIPGRSIAVYRDRGRFASVLHGQPMVAFDQDQEMTGTFSAQLSDLSDGSAISRAQFIAKSGYYLSNWGTTLVGAGTEAPQLVSLEWTMAGIVHGDAADHTCLVEWCNLTGSLGEGSPNLCNFNFTSFDVYPTLT